MNFTVKKRTEYKKEYDRDLAAFTAELQEKRDELKRKISFINSIIHNTVIDTVKQLAKKYKLRVVLNSQVLGVMTVLYADPSLDLTEEAIFSLNKTLSKGAIEQMFKNETISYSKNRD
jgi:Skp family chaperone for outer membrane proteins